MYVIQMAHSRVFRKYVRQHVGQKQRATRKGSLGLEKVSDEECSYGCVDRLGSSGWQKKKRGKHETSSSPIPLFSPFLFFFVFSCDSESPCSSVLAPEAKHTGVSLTHHQKKICFLFLFMSGTRHFVKIMFLPFAMLFRFFPLNFKYLENRQRGGNWQTRSKVHSTQPRQLRRS